MDWNTVNQAATPNNETSTLELVELCWADARPAEVVAHLVVWLVYSRLLAEAQRRNARISRMLRSLSIKRPE